MDTFQILYRNRFEWALFILAIAIVTSLCASLLMIDRSTIIAGEHDRIQNQVEVTGEVIENQVEEIRKALQVVRSIWVNEAHQDWAL